MTHDTGNALASFAFDDSLVRAYADGEGNPWFVAKDVCRVLSITNHRDAVSQLDEDERGGVGITDSIGRQQHVTTVSESGLYSLVFRSRKPEAKRFRKWVTSEVLPALRKSGCYSIGAPAPAALPGQDMPDLFCEEALQLRPAIRQRLWQDAMQAARLDNAGSDAARVWFRNLCKLMVASRRIDDHWSSAEAFMDDCLESLPGTSTPASAIYAAFQKWWRAHKPGTVPSPKYLSGVLQTRYRLFKASCMRYRDCHIIAPGS